MIDQVRVAYADCAFDSSHTVSKKVISTIPGNYKNEINRLFMKNTNSESKFDHNEVNIQINRAIPYRFVTSIKEINSEHFCSLFSVGEYQVLY